MPDCDGIFEIYNIPFEPQYADIAVHAVWYNFYTDIWYAKFLIQCWFDNTYGSYNATRFDYKDSRVQMANYLRSTPFRTYEELLETREAWNSEERNSI